MPPLSSISLTTSSSFSCVRATRIGIPPAAAILCAAARADAARAARDDHGLAVDRALEGAVLEQVRVEVALPVVPQLVAVGLERRDLDARAGQRALGVARVELRHQPDVLHHVRRDAEVGEEVVADALQRRDLHRVAHDALRQHVRHLLVDPHDRMRRVRGAGEEVQDVAGLLRLGVDEVERLPVEAVLVGDVVHRGGDVVDRDDVGLAPLDRDQREPLRERVADLLDGLEEVVGAVDLVHLAGLGVADDDRRAVDPPGHAEALADELLGLELGPVVGVRQLLALVEHVLGEVAVVGAGDRDRGRVVEVLGLEVVGEVDRVLRAADVGLARCARRRRPCRRSPRGGRSGRRCRAAASRVAVVHAEQRLREIADDRLDARLRLGAPALDQLVQAVHRALAHEHVDVALALEQLLDEVAADEPGRAGDEVAQRISPWCRDLGGNPTCPRRPVRHVPPRPRSGRRRGPRRRCARGRGGPRARGPARAAGPARRARPRGRSAASPAGTRRASRPARARARRAVPGGTSSVTRPIASASSAATMRPVRIRSSARPSPTIRGSRWVPPSISGTPQRRSAQPKLAVSAAIRRSHHSGELEPAGQAPAVDGGDRRLGRRPAGEAERAAGRVGIERPDRLEVGAGAERLVARAGEHEHAGVVVGLEGVEPGGSAAAVSPSTALRRSGRSIVSRAAAPRRS